MIYFDNAATSGKKPPEVISAVTDALKNYSVNPGRSGYEISLKAAEKVFAVREKAARFFVASGAQNVIFTLNCTHSINCVIKGILKKGDHAVVSSMEHNAVMRPLVKSGNLYSVAEVSLTDDEETFENFKNALKPNTKLVICTAASNVTGKILPLEKIGKICRERNVYFAVDAAQGAGVLPIDMKKMSIDFLCIAPHKSLYAPMGVGILICEKYLCDTLIEGGTGTNSLELSQPVELPERHESGTVNLPAIFGIGAGIDFVERVGSERIYTHEAKLIGSMYKGLKENRNIELYTPFPKKDAFVPVLSFNYKELDSFKASALLAEKGIATRGGYHCAPSAHGQLSTLDRGLVRVSVSAFNSETEVQRFLNIISDEKYFKKV